VFFGLPLLFFELADWNLWRKNEKDQSAIFFFLPKLIGQSHLLD